MSALYRASKGSSRAFSDLVVALDEWVETFFPGGVPVSNPLVSPTDDELRRSAALTIFAHAELQGYFEARARELLSTIETFAKKGKGHGAAATLALFYEDSRVVAPEKLEQPKAGAALFWRRLTRAVEKHRQTINDNAGIKESNLSHLFSPLGFQQDDFGTVLIPELNTFGRDRGEYAHSAFKSKKVIKFPPDDIASRVKKILTEMQVFDGVLTRKITGNGW